MSFASSLHRTLLIALASLALSAPAALARPADLRSEAPTSSLSGTTDQTSAEATPGRVLRRAFDPYPEPMSALEAALAQERSYSTYGEPATPTGRHRLRRRDRVCAVRSRPLRRPGRRAGRRKRAAGPPPRHPAGDLNASRTRHRGPAPAGPRHTRLSDLSGGARLRGCEPAGHALNRHLSHCVLRPLRDGSGFATRRQPARARLGASASSGGQFGTPERSRPAPRRLRSSQG